MKLPTRTLRAKNSAVGVDREPGEAGIALVDAGEHVEDQKRLEGKEAPQDRSRRKRDRRLGCRARGRRLGPIRVRSAQRGRRRKPCRRKRLSAHGLARGLPSRRQPYRPAGGRRPQPVGRHPADARHRRAWRPPAAPPPRHGLSIRRMTASSTWARLLQRAIIGNDQSVRVAIHDQGQGLRRGDHRPAGPGIEAELAAIPELR